MAGPQTHKIALKEVARRLNLPIKVNWATATELDLIDTHGYDVPTKEGSLLVKLERWIELPLLTKEDNYFYLRTLCHLIVDALTVGQISKDLWGAKDNWMDIMDYFVPRKLLLYKISSPDLLIGVDPFLHLKSSIHFTYDNYHDKALSPRFVSTYSFREMIRHAVRLGIIYTCKFAKG